MKTKENKKRQILSDEELQGVVGGLVQLVNPSSYECGKNKNKKDCLATKNCCWGSFGCITGD